MSLAFLYSTIVHLHTLIPKEGGVVNEKKCYTRNGQIWFNGNCAFLLDSMIVDGMVEMNIPPTGIWSLQTARALRQLTGGVGVFTQSF